MKNLQRRKNMKKIQILGTGCPKCNALAQASEKAAKELGIEYDLEKITSINEITGFGVIMTPGLVVDGEIKSVGRVPDPDEMKRILSE